MGYFNKFKLTSSPFFEHFKSIFIMMKLLTITFLVALAAIAIAEDAGSDGSGTADRNDGPDEMGTKGNMGTKGKNAGGGGGNKGMGEASEDGPDMTNNGMGGSHDHSAKSGSEDGPDMQGGGNNGMSGMSKGESGGGGSHDHSAKSGSATSGGGSSPSSVNGKGKMMSEATLSTGGSAFAGVGAIALVAGVGFVAVRQYKSRAGYKIIDTTPLEEVTAEQQAPLIV